MTRVSRRAQSHVDSSSFNPGQVTRLLRALGTPSIFRPFSLCFAYPVVLVAVNELEAFEYPKDHSMAQGFCFLSGDGPAFVESPRTDRLGSAVAGGTGNTEPVAADRSCNHRGQLAWLGGFVEREAWQRHLAGWEYRQVRRRRSRRRKVRGH